MISVRIGLENQFYHTLLVRGHAPGKFGVKGENILCAAVSVLSQTLLLVLLEDNNASIFENQPGNLSFEIKSPTEKSNIQFEFLFKGLKNLESQYRDIIKIEIKGEDDGT